MARRALKVFRTSAGFEDVYVAAPSRKAALAAWGTDKDLFARKLAEQVTDAELIREPLARPGEIVRLPRGTVAQHLAAAGPRRKVTAARPTAPPPGKATPPPPKARQPRPSRARLDAARSALEAGTREFAGALSALEAEIAALQRKRDKLRAERDRTLDGLKAEVTREFDAYSTALDDWKG